jgi:hypothetical protein
MFDRNFARRYDWFLHSLPVLKRSLGSSQSQSKISKSEKVAKTANKGSRDMTYTFFRTRPLSAYGLLHGLENIGRNLSSVNVFPSLGPPRNMNRRNNRQSYQTHITVSSRFSRD